MNKMAGKLKKLNYDKFCWICCVDDTNQNCWSCERTFHIACTKENISGHVLWLCPVCVTIKSARIADKICKQRGIELLPLIMKRVYDNPSYSVLKSPNDDSSAKVAVQQRSASIVKEMDLSIIMENITNYRNFEEFLADIEWMVHNCIILYTKLHLKTRTARALFDYLTKEIEIVKMCIDCYRNANIRELGWFTLVCRKPHLVVWTKRCDSNYWPAKVMSINGEEVMVQFFGNHTTTSVPAAASCFLYSDDNPHHTNVSSYLYKSALKETNQYIGNVCKKFGSYKLAANGRVFDPTMTDIDVYLADAIPDFDGFDEDSNDETDANVDDSDRCKNNESSNVIDSHEIENRIEQNTIESEVKAEKVGKIQILSEGTLQSNAAKRARLNNNCHEKPTTNKQIAPLKSRNENSSRKNIELLSPPIQSINKIDDTAPDSLNGISSNIAAELLKNFAFAENTLKHLVNQQLEKLLNDERAKYALRIDAMQNKLNEVNTQLEHANAKILELQQIAERKSQQLEKRDRQLAQAHLDYNDLLTELYNAKHLCDACGKNNRKS